MARQVGRPTSYLPEFCDTVIQCGMEGQGLMEMCFSVCRSYETFQRWQEIHPDFSKAVNTAKRLSQAWWERKGREATFDSKDFSATSYIFQMKNRFREDWRDRHDVEMTGNMSHSVSLSDMTDDQLADIATGRSPRASGTT